MVLRGFTTIWSLATLPTRSSPFSEIATTLGRMSAPLSLGTTFAILLRTYATHVFVVPRSIPRRMGFSAISFRLEELEGDAQDGANHGGAQVPRADAPELDRHIAARDGQERRLQLVDVHRGNPAEPARRLVTELARAQRDALQHLGLVAAFVDEIEDVAEERAEALPGRIARAGRGRGGLHARTLARGKQRP